MLAIGLPLLRTVCEQHLELCGHIVVVANRPLSILRARQQIAFDHIVVDESKLGRETLLVVAALPDMDNRAVVLGGPDVRARTNLPLPLELAALNAAIPPLCVSAGHTPQRIPTRVGSWCRSLRTRR